MTSPAPTATTGPVKPKAPDAKAGAPAEPQDPKEALSSAKAAVKAAKEGKWWYFSALVLMLLMFLMKRIGKKMGWWATLGRWRYVISPVLSVTAGLLAAFQGGLSFEAALAVFTSSYATSSLEELWSHGIRGIPHGAGKS